MDTDSVDALPPFLDPILDYLYQVLPPPLDNILTTVLAHGITLARSLYSLAVYMASSHPSTWSAETILPPVISLLVAYLALVSAYRTTSWMVRTSIWFLKWGSIIGTLFAGLGYLLGNAAGGGAGHGLGDFGFGNLGQGGGGGIARAVGGMLWSALNGGQNQGTRGARTRARKGDTSGSGGRKDKPRAWDSFDAHDQHRFGEKRDHTRGRGTPDVNLDEQGGEGVAGAPIDAQNIMGQIVGFAGRMGWLDAMKGVMEGATKAGGESTGKEGAQKKQPRRKAKAGTGTGTR